MFRTDVIEPGSREAEQYIEKRRRAFPKLAMGGGEDGRHIALYYKSRLVGGATLMDFRTIGEDEDVSRLWEVACEFAGTRILRLWIEAEHPAMALVQLFDALQKNIADDNFIYGILAVSLKYAREEASLFEKNKGWLRPRCALEECDWDLGSKPSSEGEKLVAIYKRMGCEFLGPASGSVEERTVRVVMGVENSKVRRG